MPRKRTQVCGTVFGRKERREIEKYLNLHSVGSWTKGKSYAAHIKTICFVLSVKLTVAATQMQEHNVKPSEPDSQVMKTNTAVLSKEPEIQ